MSPQRHLWSLPHFRTWDWTGAAPAAGLLRTATSLGPAPPEGPVPMGTQCGCQAGRCVLSGRQEGWGEEAGARRGGTTTLPLPGTLGSASPLKYRQPSAWDVQQERGPSFRGRIRQEVEGGRLDNRPTKCRPAHVRGWEWSWTLTECLPGRPAASRQCGAPGEGPRPGPAGRCHRTGCPAPECALF